MEGKPLHSHQPYQIEFIRPFKVQSLRCKLCAENAFLRFNQEEVDDIADSDSAAGHPALVVRLLQSPGQHWPC
jgi:hypothetical protein